MSRSPILFALKHLLLSSLLTVGLFLHGSKAFSLSDETQSSFKNVHQKLMDLQPEVDSVDKKRLESGDLPLSAIEVIELEELKVEIVQEISRLQNKLADLQKQIVDIDQNLIRLTIPKKIGLTNIEIKELLKDEIGTCQISAIENSKAFKITEMSRGESIEFFFSDPNSETAVFAEFTSIATQNDGVKIIQPSFKPSELKKASEMSATISYRVNEQGIEFLFVTFLGQKIEDKLFRASSRQPFRVVCKTSL